MVLVDKIFGHMVLVNTISRLIWLIFSEDF